MKFDYTKGKEAKFKVSIIYSKQDDYYYFSELEEAKALYSKVVEEQGEEVASVTLRDLSKKGRLSIIEKFSNYDEVRDSTGKQIAYYEPKDKAIYILTACLTPKVIVKTKESRQAFRESFNKSYDERIELYSTDEEKKIIKDFIAKHAGAKISEFTPLYF